MWNKDWGASTPRQPVRVEKSGAPVEFEFCVDPDWLSRQVESDPIDMMRYLVDQDLDMTWIRHIRWLEAQGYPVHWTAERDHDWRVHVRFELTPQQHTHYLLVMPSVSHDSTP